MLVIWGSISPGPQSLSLLSSAGSWTTPTLQLIPPSSSGKKPGAEFSQDTGILSQLPFLKSPRQKSKFPHASPENPTSGNAPLPRQRELAARRQRSTQPRALPRSPPQPQRREAARAALRPGCLPARPWALCRKPGLLFSRREGAPAPCGAPERTQALGESAAPRARTGDAARRPAPAERPGSGAAGEGRVPEPRSPHARGRRDRRRRRAERVSRLAAPGPPPQPAWRALQPRAPAGTAAGLALRSRLRAGLGAKLSRRKPLVRGRRTSSRARKLCAPSPPRPRPTENMAPSNVVPRCPPGIPKCPPPGPRIPAGAKSQLEWPQEERAPLVQCHTESKPCPGALGGRCPRASASDQRFAGDGIAKHGAGVEEAGTRVRAGEGAGHQRAVFARSLAGDLFAKWRWSRGGQCWNEAVPPAPTLLARGPGRGRGDTPGGRGRFSKPSSRKASGSSGGDRLPAARNPL